MIEQLLVRVAGERIGEQLPERPQLPLGALDRFVHRLRHALQCQELPDLRVRQAGAVSQLVPARLPTMLGQILSVRSLELRELSERAIGKDHWAGELGD